MAKSGLAKQHKKPARRLSVSNRVETLIQKTFAEFFAGIGLMRRGLEKEGWSVSFANDIDPKKHEMYVENFEDADKDFLLGDVHEIPADVIPNVTLATASFPCTDLSLAGGREGLNGTQSSAFWGFVRVLRDMGERKPKLVLLENVLGFLTSHEGWDFFEAMTALNRLGYSVDAFVLDAAWFVPQSRQRLFVVGILDHQLVERNLEVRETEFRPRQLAEFINNHSEINWRVRDLPPRPNRRQALDLILEDLDDDSKEWWSSERAQYLVGAKLQLRFPGVEIGNESYSTADVQLGRPGDFYIGDTAFHVTVAPQPAVYEKCKRNVEQGYRAYLLVPDRSLVGARQNAEATLQGKIAVESIESFVSQNVEELSIFSKDVVVDGFRRLLETYNERVDRTETDKSMLIEIPNNLQTR